MSGIEEPPRPSRRRWILPVLATVLGAALLAWLLRPYGGEIRDASREASLGMLAALTGLSALALVLRAEVWRVGLRAAGHDLPRPQLHGASGGTYLVSLVNQYVGPAVKIWALRRMRGDREPRVAQLVVVDLAAVLPEVLIAAALVVFAAFQVDLAWWLPVLLLVGGAGAVVVAVASRRRWADHPAAQGLNVLVHGYFRYRLLGLLVGVFLAQIVRTWLALEAVDIDASFGSATLIFVLTAVLGFLPTGLVAAPTAASVLVFGRDGVGAAAASGLLVTVSLFVATLLYTLLTAGWWLAHRSRAARHRSPEAARPPDSSSPHPAAGR